MQTQSNNATHQVAITGASMKLKSTLLRASIALGTLAFTLPSLTADPVKIGLVLPMSGPFAAYGQADRAQREALSFTKR